MNKNCSSGLFLTLASTVFGQQCGTVQRLEPIQKSDISGTARELQAVFDREEFDRVDSLNRELHREFGNQAGIPEIVEPSIPLVERVEWIPYDSAIRLAGRYVAKNSTLMSNLWRLGRGEAPPDFHPHSQYLRTAAEFGVGLLLIAKHDPDPIRSDSCRSWARRTFDTLAARQLPNGAFPFPDLREYGNATFTPIIEKVLAMAAGDTTRVLRDGWIVDDLGSGEFKFDAGVICDAFFQAWILTGDTRYKAVSERTAAYLLPLRLSVNYNYNSFTALGLSRGFILTHDSTYLRQAKANIRWGVLPGQLPSGRWVDGHNAKTVYAGIIVNNSSALLSTMAPDDPERSDLDSMLVLAAGDLAARTRDCGATTGFRWLLSLENLPKGILPETLLDSLRILTGRYINQAATDGRFLDPLSLGMYLESLRSRQGNAPTLPGRRSKSSVRWSIQRLRATASGRIFAEQKPGARYRPTSSFELPTR